MKILIVMDPGIIVPPKGYGGHERLVAMFAEAYKRQGHEVHLLVTPGSYIKGCIIHPFGKEGFPPQKKDALKTILYAWRFLFKHYKDFDLVHNFGRLAYLAPLFGRPIHKIMTYGREINNRNIRWTGHFGSKNLTFTACSENLLSRVNAPGNWKVVYNAVEFEKYELQEMLPALAPLIFLGRLEKIKGCHTAIKVALATGNKLIIAGNISPLDEEQAYFKAEIEPLIDGDIIRYVGQVDDDQKNEWLGKAKALLFPITWNEPFGIVMVEAMACGTPVIAFEMGSVSEVIDEGITGFKVNDFDEMVEAVNRVKELDRIKCRQYAKKRFDTAIIASAYLELTRPQKKAVIVTTGQPAANPRVVKEYEALKQQNYQVKVLYTYSAEWSYRVDEEKFKTGKLVKRDFVLIGGNPYNQRISYFFSRALFKVISIVVRIMPFRLFKEITLARSSFYLWLKTKKYKANVYIAHYLGALPAAMRASSKYGAAIVFDAEDFHRGEEPYYPNQITNVIEIEDHFLPLVNLITTASPLISNAYQKLYPGKEVITINNVFSKNFLQPVSVNGSGRKELKLFWFSQNIGPNRGLEGIIDAFNCLDEDVSLTLLGNIRNKKYVSQLLERSKHPEKIRLLKPVNPEQIFKVASAFDIGLAAEIPYCRNRDICLTNKIFTYLLAGNCVLVSDTTAQKEFIKNYPAVGALYKHDDVSDLCRVIKYYHDNRDQLDNCKRESSELAKQTLNWETESTKLINIIDSLVANV